MAQEEITALAIVAATFALLYIGRHIVRLLKDQVKELEARTNLDLLDFLSRVIEPIILQVQKEYTTENGEFKAALVASQVQDFFPDLLEKLRLNKLQLDYVIKRVYEHLRDTNFGERFDAPVNESKK